MTDPYGRTPEGLWARTLQRLQAVEDRFAKILPGRLGPIGQQVTDWHHATAPGFYWADAAAANGPYATTMQGHVDIGNEDRIIQSLTNMLNPGVTWKRARWNPNRPTSFNGAPAASSVANPRWAAEWQSRWGWNRGEQAAGGPTGGRFIRWTCPSTQDSSSRGWNAYYNLDFAPAYSQEATMRKVWAGEPVTVTGWVRCSKTTFFYMNVAISDGVGGSITGAVTIGGTELVPANTWTKIERTFTPGATGYLGVGFYGASGVTLVAGDTIDGAQFSVSYAQGEWTPWRRSDNLLIPVRCVGGTQAAQVTRNDRFNMQTGRYSIPVGDKYWAFDGVFTDEFRAYDIYVEYATGGSNGSGLRFRQNAAEIVSSSYEYQSLYIVGTGTPAGASGVSTQGTFPPNNAAGFSVVARIVNPAHTAGNYNQKRMLGDWSSYSPTQVATVNCNLVAYDQQIMDGIVGYVANQSGAGVVSGAEAFMYVRGVA